MAKNERDGGMTYATTANNANEFALRILSAESSPWNEPIVEERYERRYPLGQRNYILYIHQIL